MEVVKRNLRYLWYVIRHKWFVFVECCKVGIPWRGIVHDLSKFSRAEWKPYALSFYGLWGYTERPDWLVSEFDHAWLHHLHRNDHHWQYWILTQDEDQDKVLPMPDRARREMLADWRGAGRAITGKDNTKAWYLDHQDKMELHQETRDWIDSQLGYA